LLSIVGILIAVVVIAAIDIPPLRRKKWTKELVVFAVLLLFGTSLCIAEALDAKIPNPVDWIAYVYRPMTELVSAWLG
jgi:hypothetical protein